MDKRSNSAKEPGKSRFPLSKTGDGKPNTEEIRTHASGCVQSFPYSPQGAGNIAEKPAVLCGQRVFIPLWRASDAYPNLNNCTTFA